VTARSSPGLLVGVVAVAVAIPLVIATRLGDPTPPIRITVDGRLVSVEAGARLGAVLRSVGARPTRGRLLDVEGHVLDPGADPGAILVNGAPAAATTTRLRAGDVISTVDGVDRTETTRRVATRLGRGYGDPQYSLATARIVRIDTVGRISGILVSRVYRPSGGLERPRAVALTFDDGPWPRTTRAVLDVLRRMHARATFFVIGSLAQRYPAIVRDELRAGMAVGSHSWDHPEPFDALTPDRIATELGKTNRYLHEAFGLRVTLFRPPGGSGATDVVTQASVLGMRVVDWNVDPRDWADGATLKSIARAVLSHVGPGSIVDLHDGGGDRRATVRALPAIIRGIRRRGLRLVALR
jgi:peptidoglycan/xylan/chitin deacetylase (PgdA/CDA1 family)